MKKYRILICVVALATVILSAIFITYAWYINVDRVTDMKFNILQIDSLVTLYEANDDNFNGVPNLVDSGNENKYYKPEANAQVDYEKRYYDENYSFDYVDQRYALSQDSKANLLNSITISNVAPSKIYGYKFEVINYVGLDNKLQFEFIKEESYTADTTILKDFEARLGIVDENAKVLFSNWTSFSNGTSYSGFALNPLANPITIPATTGTLNVGRLDLWLQIRIKPDATNHQISNFILPKYRITLSCEMSE